VASISSPLLNAAGSRKKVDSSQNDFGLPREGKKKRNDPFFCGEEKVGYVHHSSGFPQCPSEERLRWNWREKRSRSVFHQEARSAFSVVGESRRGEENFSVNY